MIEPPRSAAAPADSRGRTAPSGSRRQIITSTSSMRRRVVRPRQRTPGENVLDRLGMDLDSGQRGVERGGAKVDQPGRAGADQDDHAGDLVRVVLAGQHLPGRNEGRRIRGPELEPDRAVGIGRRLDPSPLDVVEPGLAAECLLAAGVGRLEDVGARALRDAKRLGKQRRDELVAQAVDDGYAADHLVAIRDPVDRADAGRLLVEDRQVLRAPGEAAEERQRVVTGNREPRLDLQRRVGRASGQGSGKHGRAPPDGFGQNRIMARLVREERLQPLGFRRRQSLKELLRRCLVGLGEENIEGDRGSALRRRAGRPAGRPSFVARATARFAVERLLVDIDDAHRHRRVVAPGAPAADRNRRRSAGAPEERTGRECEEPSRPRAPPTRGRSSSSRS